MCRLAITKYKERAVLKIQTAWRTYMKRKRDKIRLEKQISRKLQKKSRQRAALKIQSAWKATVKSRQKVALKIHSCKEEELKQEIILLNVLSIVGCIASIASRFAILVSYIN